MTLPRTDDVISRYGPLCFAMLLSVVGAPAHETMALDVLALEPEFFGENLSLMRKRVGASDLHRLAG